LTFSFFENVLEHVHCVNMPYIFYLNNSFHVSMPVVAMLIIQVIEAW